MGVYNSYIFPVLIFYTYITDWVPSLPYVLSSPTVTGKIQTAYDLHYYEPPEPI
jgi:hypothetical protein